MGVDRRMKELTSNEASVDLPQPLVPQSKTVTDSFLSRILQNRRIPLDTSHKPLYGQEQNSAVLRVFSNKIDHD